MAEDLRAALAQVGAEAQPTPSAQDVAARYLNDKNRREDRIRSWITLLVIGLYGICVATALGFVVLSAGTGDAPSWGDRSRIAIEVVTTFVMPIVTLVLGYYFGSKQSAGNGA